MRRGFMRRCGMLHHRSACTMPDMVHHSLSLWRNSSSPLRTLRSPNRCFKVGALSRLCRSFASQLPGEGEDTSSWQMSPKMGKSTVTQELWRRRDADSLGIGSTHAVAYRFSTSLQLRDEYVGNTGKVMVGRLLEDLDALAGNVAFDWCSDTLDENGDPPLLVTAAVDRITFSRPLMITEDMYLSGDVIWTGSSSMMVRMTMRSGRRAGAGDLLLDADFVYVALNRASRKTAKVHQLVPETAEEKKLFDLGKSKAEEKKQRRKSEGLAPPQQDAATIMAMVNEGDRLTELHSARRLAASGKVLVSRTGLQNTILTKPQDQNTAGNVFGGMLMRSCYELAFSTCFAFAARHPVFKEVSEFTFDKPVPRGSLLRLRSRVVYTAGHDAAIEVTCMVIQPEQYKTFRANKILVIFDSGGELPEVVPHTVAEVQAFFDAKKQYEESFGDQAC